MANIATAKYQKYLCIPTLEVTQQRNYAMMKSRDGARGENRR